ncbi:MAG TPA: PEGA domain-containing protein [Blastocatellia bacterium]|nr:PEGA domain-containing protein [Blastocatellia bacterium]
MNQEVSTGIEPSSSAAPRRQSAQWWFFAAASAVLLIALTSGGIYLLTKRPSTVDQLVILTVPSGAEIKLNSRDYGHSPVKLEQVPIGTYTLEITKDGYEPIIEQIPINDSRPLERKLKPLPPTGGISNLSPAEQIKRFQQLAQEAFERGRIGIPYPDSALNYVIYILNYDQSNQFAIEMKDRIGKVLRQSAQSAVARGDMAQAQDTYVVLVDNFPEDEDSRAALSRVESQLSSRKGEIKDLLTKAQEAYRAGSFVEPSRTSAYYYSKQALAIDKQNGQARAIRSQIRDRLVSSAEQALSKGDEESAVRQFEQILQYFPEERELRSKLREINTRKEAVVTTVNDTANRRDQGLTDFRAGKYAEAIPHLEFAVVNGKGTQEVVFALARSFHMRGQLDQAAQYYRLIKSSDDDAYRSAIAALGDIASQRGDTATALDRYKQARSLGGSILYSIEFLDDRIERIEKRQQEKASAPIPVTIQVKHLHGSLRGSCSGTLTVDSTGVRYDGSEDQYSYNLLGTHVVISKDQMTVQFGPKSQKFKASRGDAERFRDALNRYQLSNK